MTRGGRSIRIRSSICTYGWHPHGGVRVVKLTKPRTDWKMSKQTESAAAHCGLNGVVVVVVVVVVRADVGGDGAVQARGAPLRGAVRDEPERRHDGGSALHAQAALVPATPAPAKGQLSQLAKQAHMPSKHMSRTGLPDQLSVVVYPSHPCKKVCNDDHVCVCVCVCPRGVRRREPCTDRHTDHGLLCPCAGCAGAHALLGPRLLRRLAVRPAQPQGDARPRPPALLLAQDALHVLDTAPEPRVQGPDQPVLRGAAGVLLARGVRATLRRARVSHQTATFAVAACAHV